LAIVQNKATAIGDTILIQTSVPILGVVTLQSFVNNTIGETGTRFFDKKFRYSTDGINYSLWIPLTTLNVSQIVFSSTSIFLIEYSYQRLGTDPTGDLEFVNNSLIGEFSPVTGGPIYANSPFATFFPSYDVNVLTWCLNVCEKLYKPGIIPIYMTRGENANKNNEDEDYMAFWCTVCCFFSLFVNFARLFENFDLHKDILEEYLLQKGLLFCNNNTSLVDLNYLMNNYYNEISKRGTMGIVNKKLDGFPVDGELLRLLCNESEGPDDIIFSLTESHKLGWNIGNSSPLYRGNQKANMCVVGYENNFTIDPLNYPQLNSANISILPKFIDGGFQDAFVFNFFNNTGDTGINLQTLPTQRQKIKVDKLISYEFTFDYWVEKSATNLRIVIGSFAFDVNNNPLLLNNLNGGSNDFCNNTWKGKTNSWYNFRGIIYGLNVNTLNLTKDLENFIGGHLQFVDPNTDYICPQVYITLDGGPTNLDSQLFVTNVRVRPLTTPYSTGFVQTKNFINIWGQNKNKKYSKEKIQELEKRFLIPYNSHLSNVFVNESEINTTI